MYLRITDNQLSLIQKQTFILHDCDPDSLHLTVEHPCSTCHTIF